jgi:hypothetical protein
VLRMSNVSLRFDEAVHFAQEREAVVDSVTDRDTGRLTYRKLMLLGGESDCISIVRMV